MNRRRITIGAAVLVSCIVALLVVTHWSTVRDHVEAWRFQATTKTEVFEPFLGLRGKLLSFCRDWLEARKSIVMPDPEHRGKSSKCVGSISKVNKYSVLRRRCR